MIVALPGLFSYLFLTASSEADPNNRTSESHYDTSKPCHEVVGPSSPFQCHNSHSPPYRNVAQEDLDEKANCPRCKRTVLTRAAECEMCKNWVHYRCDRLTADEIDMMH